MLLNFVGVISARAFVKGWRVAILLIADFTAIATPAAAVFSMFLPAVPMVFLYVVAADVAWIYDRGVAKRTAALDAELAGK